MSQPEKICARLHEAGIIVGKNISAGEFTTFRTGGPAALLITADTQEKLRFSLAVLEEEAFPFLLVGNGSNILFGSGGYAGAVVRIVSPRNGIVREENKLRAFAGVSLARLASFALREGLSGMEALSGIPGTVGGGVRMNAGAYGTSVSDILSGSLSLRKGEEQWLSLPKHAFGYRRSIYISEPQRVCAEAVFSLTPEKPEIIEEKMRRLSFQRRSKQPLEFPSAGSTFRRPEGHFAGKLIEDAGLKGMRVGGAEVSEKHAGFVINREDATPEDIVRLMRKIQDAVWDSSGVRLCPEVELVGEFALKEGEGCLFSE